MVYLADRRYSLILRVDILACIGTAGAGETGYYNDDGLSAENARLYWHSNACQKRYQESLSEYDETKTALNNALGASPAL